MKLQELLTSTENYDTRKVLNRSGKTIPQSVLDEIEDGGITSERLQDLGVPVYRYKTQITVHGLFPKLQDARIGGYKYLIQNDNLSLGIKYNAIDFDKKQTIYTCLKHCQWIVNRDSTNWIAYLSSGVCFSRDELLPKLQELKDKKSVLDTRLNGLYIGDCTIGIYSAFGLGIFGALVLDIKAIDADQVDNLILAVSGKERAQIESEIELERIERKKQDAIDNAEYERQEQERAQLRKQKLDALTLPDCFEYLESANSQEGYFLKLKFNYSDEIVYHVRKVFKYGKMYRVKSKDYAELQDAMDCMRNNRITNTRGSKELAKQSQVYRIRNEVQDTPKDTTTKQTGAIVRRNLDKNGIEIVFPNKPDQTVLDTLKLNGFHWSFVNKLWYTSFDTAKLSWAQSQFA